MNQRFKLLTLLSLFVSISSFGMEKEVQLTLKKAKIRYCLDDDKKVFEGAFLLCEDLNELRSASKCKINNRNYTISRDCMGGFSFCGDDLTLHWHSRMNKEMGDESSISVEPQDMFERGMVIGYAQKGSEYVPMDQIADLIANSLEAESKS